MENSEPITELKVEQMQLPSSEASPSLSLAQRRAFMRLTLEQRRRLLAQQAEQMWQHYQKNTEWQELQTGDLVDY